MAFIFPEDKNDFTAPNGVTYSWDGVKWVTKTFESNDQNSVHPDTFQADQVRQDNALGAEREARISGDLTLNADLQTESAARERGDSDLQAQLDDLELDGSGRDFSTITVTTGERLVWIEGDEPQADEKGRAGWFFENEGPSSKAHWSLWAQEKDAPVQLTLGDIEALGIVLRNKGVANPFIQIYTHRESDRDNANATYRSRMSYFCGEDISKGAGLTVLTTNLDTALYDNLSRHLMELEDFSMQGPCDPSEVIKNIVIGTSSGLDAGNVSMLVEKFFLQAADQAYGVSLSASAEVDLDFSEIKEHLEKLDTDIEVLNKKADFNAEEAVSDRDRQDKELADYKEEVALQQEAQDDRIQALEDEERFDDSELKGLISDEEAARIAADQDLQDQIDAIDLSGSGGAAYLNDLLDVDLSGTRSSFLVVENEFTWLHYKTGTPDAGEISNNGDALVLHKQAWGGIDPSDLINRIEPGTIMAFRGIVPGSGIDERGVVVSITSKGNTWEIAFKEKLAFLSILIDNGFDTEAVNVSAGYAGQESPAGPDPDPGPDPVPPGDTVTAGTFLGYDKDKALWVPQTLDVSGGGVTDLSDYYTKEQTYSKTEVDEKIDAIDVDVDLGDYYTKAEVDASQEAQDLRLDALEAGGGGGGSVDLDNYYTKDETYTKEEVDRPLQAEIQARVTGDVALQEQIDELKASDGGGSGKDLEPQVNANSAGVLKNKQDIEAINVDQGKQDKAIGDLEEAVIEGFGNRYTKDEVDEKFDALEDADLSGLMVTDGRNKVTEAWRLVNEDNTTTYISTFEGQLGLYNVKYPEKAVHGVNKQYADDKDAETLQAAKDYADGIEIPEVDLDDYYTKGEVDASQQAQDELASELAETVAIISGKVDQNIIDIDALETSHVVNLGDLGDVTMTARSFTPEEPATRDNSDSVGQEELSYSCQFKGYNKNSGRITDGRWGFDRGVLFLSKEVHYGSEADDLFANLLVGNKVYLQAAHNNLNLPKAPDRATIVSIDDLGNCLAYTFDDPLAELGSYMGRTWDTDDEATIQVALSEIIVVPEVPEVPGTPTKRSDIVLGFDSNEKMWSPHLADYLPSTGGMMTGTLSFRKGSKDYNQFQISPNGGEDYATNIYSRNGGQMRFRTTPDKNGDTNYKTHIVLNGADKTTRIYQLADPTRDDHAANKAYVDRVIAAPAKLGWKFAGSKDSSADPGSGKFYYHPGGNNGVNGYLRFSFITNNGCDLSDGKFNDTNTVIDNGPVGTIWQWRPDSGTGRWKLIMQFRIKTFRWNFNNHFEFGLSSSNGRAFSEMGDTEYCVTVGGFF